MAGMYATAVCSQKLQCRSTIEVVQSSADDLYRAYAQGAVQCLAQQLLMQAGLKLVASAGILPQLDMDLLMYIILGAATLIKVLVRAEWLVGGS